MLLFSIILCGFYYKLPMSISLKSFFSNNNKDTNKTESEKPKTRKQDFRTITNVVPLYLISI